MRQGAGQIVGFAGSGPFASLSLTLVRVGWHAYFFHTVSGLREEEGRLQLTTYASQHESHIETSH